MDMRCRRVRTNGREAVGRFGIRFWAIMGRVDWFGYVRRWIAIRCGHRKRFEVGEGWFSSNTHVAMLSALPSVSHVFNSSTSAEHLVRYVPAFIFYLNNNVLFGTKKTTGSFLTLSLIKVGSNNGVRRIEFSN
jgi:hypothetical protein